MRFLVGAFLLCFCSALYGQNDKVFLKNGSLIRGILVDGDITDTLLIDVRGSIVTVPLEVVAEIRRPMRNGYRLEGYRDFSYSKGWSTVPEFGIIAGSHKETGDPSIRASLRVSQEYRYHPFLNGGIGMGILYYHAYNIFPLTLDYHAVLGRRHRSWIVYGSVGYGFAQAKGEGENEYKVSGGIFYQTGLGWQQRVGRNAIRLKMGYAVQAIEEEKELSPNYIERRTRRMNRITAQVAYVFKY